MTEQAAPPPAGGSNPPQQPEAPAQQPETPSSQQVAEATVPPQPGAPEAESIQGTSAAPAEQGTGEAASAREAAAATPDADAAPAEQGTGAVAPEQREGTTIPAQRTGPAPAEQGSGPAPTAEEGMGPAGEQGMGPAGEEGMGPAGEQGTGPADEPEPAKARSAAGIVKVLVVALLAFGAVVAGGLAWKYVNSVPETAAVGECMVGQNENDIKTIKCDDPKAEHKVVGKIEGKMTESQFTASKNPCPDFPTAERAFWSGKKGDKGDVLCLEPIKR
ncbi:hypothetical protein AB0J86_20305 [Micromonospora sp. NPDC049559]|uniref:LppU/SCO3897 family protein n=1 Tax=Micromonospora sp. NPDC049559 TaxID=3155923 RepID=UPI00343FCB56